MAPLAERDEREGFRGTKGLLSKKEEVTPTEFSVLHFSFQSLLLSPTQRVAVEQPCLSTLCPHS